MGNSQSAIAKAINPYEKEIKEVFKLSCETEVFTQCKFKEHFVCPSEVVTNNLFERYFKDILNENEKTANLFVERVQYILDIVDKPEDEQFDFYLDLLTRPNESFDKTELERIVKKCQQFGCLELITCEKADGDEISTSTPLIHSIVKTCDQLSSENLRENFLEWCKQCFPKIFSGIKSWIIFKFTNVPRNGTQANDLFRVLPVPYECQSSNTQLNPTLLWFLCCLIPSCFTRLDNKYKISDEDDDSQVDQNLKYTWNLLYDSNQHGLSLNRFKHKVMNYKSPTISLIEFSSGITTLLAIDEPWRDSPDKFGGPYCMLVQIHPTVEVIEVGSKMIYLKELGRSIPTGLLIGAESRPKISIDKDLSTAQINYKHLMDESVDRMEVWGCGGVTAIKSQADQKKWESREIEKRKKVKLPGQWDGDKTILEMGGVTVNHNQRGDI